MVRKRADRVALLVDGEAYFRAVAASLARARRQVLIAGWDIDPDVVLWRGDDPGPPPPRRSGLRGPGPPLPPQLGPLLDALARRRHRLRCHVLPWDFGTLFAVKRGFVPVFHLDWNSHRRVVVRLDSAHPFGASVHVKAACVDDTVAYVGGLDLTRKRWDRPPHAALDPLRVDPDGQESPPFHDQQILVSGPAAHAVGAWLRDRWRRATGQRLAPPPGGLDAWPAGLAPDLTEVVVGLCRTEPPWDDHPPVAEIERLYLEVIHRARRTIYLENQYITSHSLAHALARRLAEPDGPEVLIVTSLRSTGWLEQASMDVRRAAFVEELRRADRHGRLRILTPRIGPELHLKVHTKAAFVDDWFLTVGSANLANRSMGLDVELNLAIEAEGPAEAQVRALVPLHRQRLLGEFLGIPGQEVAAAVAAHDGSLLRALDALRARAGEHTLVDLEAAPGTAIVPAILSDPEHALDLADWAAKAVPDGLPRSILGAALRAAAGIMLFVALESVWHGLPRDVASHPEEIQAWLEPAGPHPAAIVATLAALVGAGLLPVPMGALICLVGFAFGLGPAFALTVAGGVPGALLGWLVGRRFGPNLIRAAAVPRLNALSRRLARGGMLSVAELRIVPRHTWAEVNLVAGASRVDLRDFLAGTALGLAPGALVLGAAGALVGHAVRHPGLFTVPAALAVLVLLAAGMAWLWRRQELLPARRGLWS